MLLLFFSCYVIEFNSLTLEQQGVQSCTPLCFSWISQLPIGIFRCASRITRAIKAWWNDVEIFEIVQPVFELRHRKWRRCGWFFSKNLTNLMTIERKGVNNFWSKFNVAALVFEDAVVTAADSNIALCTIRCEFNRKS